jgi:hypothetical protein
LIRGTAWIKRLSQAGLISFLNSTNSILKNQPLETKLRTMAATLNTLHADGRIVFSFPEEALPLSEQVSFVAFVKAEWVARQSRFTQQDADRLADEVDASWWSNNKQRILSQIAAA